MAEVRFVLADDAEGNVGLSIDFNPELPEDPSAVTDAQFAGLMTLEYIVGEIFQANVEGFEIRGAEPLTAPDEADAPAE